LIIAAALIVAAAVAWAGLQVARQLASARRPGDSADQERVAQIISIFTPGIAAAAEDPRSLLVWQPTATAARKLFPREFTALDQAFGRAFPFTEEQMQAAHARWTTDWLTWERTHDGECKLKAAAVEEELGDRTATPYGRARLDAIEREKLERYQRRYEEYTRVSRALQVLINAGTSTSR
jgi:hypothetical protein